MAAITKQTALENAKCIIIKVGSAVLTDENGLSFPVLESLVEQIAHLHKMGKKVCLVSSGAVAAGKKTLGTSYKIEGLAGKQGAAAIGQGKLMHEYEVLFQKHGILCAQILLTRDDLRSRERFLNAKNTFQQLLQWNVVPIVNENDTVVIHELKFDDNDALASLLCNIVEADLSINLTSTKGVLAKNPLKYPNEQIEIMEQIENIQDLNLDELCGGKTSVGTGGMYSKLLSARRSAQLGVATFIIPGKEPNIILRALQGEKIGTWICPTDAPVSRRKYWLAYQSDAQGILTIDEGAYLALSEKGKSLLPAGITHVEGNFGAGSIVAVVYQNQKIAVGLSNYSASELRKIKGLSRLEVAAALGNAHYPEVIHRDNLLLHAAI